MPSCTFKFSYSLICFRCDFSLQLALQYRRSYIYKHSWYTLFSRDLTCQSASLNESNIKRWVGLKRGWCGASRHCMPGVYVSGYTYTGLLRKTWIKIPGINVWYLLPPLLVHLASEPTKSFSLQTVCTKVHQTWWLFFFFLFFFFVFFFFFFFGVWRQFSPNPSMKEHTELILPENQTILALTC